MQDEDERFSANSALRDDREVGVAAVSSSLFANVTTYHASIGANVDKNSLQQLEWNLLADAKTLFHQRKFEEALNTFTHCLAVTEKTRSATDHAVRGAVIHNIASCLHNLGEMEAAQAYYEQAIESFKKAKTPLLERALYGDANKRRVEFVKERLVDITWGRKPDGDKYLDENGVKRPVAAVYGQPPERGAEDGEQILSDRWRVAPGEATLYGEEPAMPSWTAATRGNDDCDSAHAGASSASSSARHYYDDPAPNRREDHEKYGGASTAPPPGGGGGAHEHGGPHEGGNAPNEDDEAQEAARKEWLQYHLQTGEWDKAEELIVTDEEREDLRYLMERERRERMQRAQHIPSTATAHGGHSQRAASGQGGSVRGARRGEEEEEDQML